ncbi:hypothetical protein I314_05241 [Cryptococcus bacillisporus CA1873]|uniref:Uncharacterized protein n=1 Tax=Cryptococcus bacillisporus CA1873 TaxID=1296111 RepID=A0ABR5B5E8_CRYGA|nr:hypothetical protein I314_05241 [Cryptococcus bacillisporus CA1873]|eukprot:KIR58828.1 hypothetical protein I314_05241 [Cryptococcus gattii CA1873]
MIDNTLRIVFQVTALVVGLIMRFWTPACIKLGLGKRLFHTRYPVWIGIPLCALSIGIDINFVQHPRRKSAILPAMLLPKPFTVLVEGCSKLLLKSPCKLLPGGVSLPLSPVYSTLLPPWAVLSVLPSPVLSGSTPYLMLLPRTFPPLLLILPLRYMAASQSPLVTTLNPRLVWLFSSPKCTR